MAELLCGWKTIIRKGDLYKIIAVNYVTRKPPLFHQSLVLLDLRNTKVGTQGLCTLKKGFSEALKILVYS